MERSVTKKREWSAEKDAQIKIAVRPNSKYLCKNLKVKMSDILLNTIPEAIEDLKNGKIIIVVDDEDRENEGDFLSAAELTTPETVSYTHLDVYKRQATTLYQAFVNIIRNDRKPFSPPIDDMDEIWNPMEKAGVLQKLRYSFVGSAETVRNQIQHFQETFNVDEIMITSHIYEHEARLKSYEMIRKVVDSL